MSILYDPSFNNFIIPGKTMPEIIAIPGKNTPNYLVAGEYRKLDRSLVGISGCYIEQNVKKRIIKQSSNSVGEFKFKRLKHQPSELLSAIDIVCPSITTILQEMNLIASNASRMEKIYLRFCEKFIIENTDNYIEWEPKLEAKKLQLNLFDPIFNPIYPNPGQFASFASIFNQIKFFLKDFIYDSIEEPIISPYSYIAGTPNMLGYFNYKDYIIDFKLFETDPTSDIMKEKIDKWFLQMAGYSIILKDIQQFADATTKFKPNIPEFGLIIGSSFNYGPFIMERNLEEYISRMTVLINEYNKIQAA